MLKKLRNIVIVLAILGGIGYGSFLVFVNPSGFTDKEELINSYFDNIQSESTCDNHFNTETQDFCLNFTDLLDSRTLEITNLAKSGEGYLVTILVDNVSLEFDVTFIEIEVTGVKSFLNSTYYKIDFIT